MPSQTNDSNRSSTLSEELNPLVNPLLAQHMGRWAEVFFTALPENREQAVLGLLYELRAEAALQENAAPPQATAPVLPNALIAEDPDSSVSFVRCLQCGYENRSDHNFCGSCRAQLRNPASAEVFFDSLLHNGNGGNAERLETPQSESQLSALESPEQRRFNPDEVDRRYAERQSRARRNEVDLFRFSSEQPQRSYRAYAWAALALLLLFVAYRTWWSGQTPSTSQTPAQLPPVVATGTAESTPVPAAPTSSASTPFNGVSVPDSSPKINGAAAEVSNETAASAPSALNPATITEGGSLPLSGSGAEELALAKSYLNGTEGKERNSAEAATLLWKAVSKQNAEATELLSDLYLKGNGVSKNCDQARILLDAAARKGRKNAGERLGHLAAFGCQ